MQPRTPLWLSHHWPDDYDRCVRIGSRHVCRRCLWFYPVWFAAMALALAGIRWPVGADVWLLWLLPLAVVVEWWVEHLDLARYSARRNVVTTLVCAPAVGVGFARYMERPTDPLFWSVVVVYGVLCAIPMVLSRRPAAAARRAHRSTAPEPATAPAPAPAPERAGSSAPAPDPAEAPRGR